MVHQFSKIQSLRYQFIAQFGNTAVKPFNDLMSILKDILHSMLSNFTATEFDLHFKPTVISAPFRPLWDLCF